MTTPVFDVVIVGVGGQGTLLSSKILGYAALQADCQVKVSEVHGMAQRGGSVITHVRVGETVYAPLVTKGRADYVLAFEALEAARVADFLKADGTLIVNTQQILPMPVITGVQVYPENPLADIEASHQVEKMDAMAMAIEAGNPKAVNLVLLGALSCHLHWGKDTWHQAIAACVPPKTLEVNLRAFELGRNISA